ncbi:MAG: signal peptidase II [Candidatus Binataceae bacterium]
MTASLRRLTLLIAIITSCVGCDQATKAVARGYLASAPPMSFFGDLFRLQYVENPGAFLSLGANLPEHLRAALMVVGGGIGLFIFALVLVTRKMSAGRFAAFSLMVAGGAGNLLDRIFNHNQVVDFMNIGIGSVRTGIFNMADVALMLGVGMIAISSLAHRDRPQARNA